MVAMALAVTQFVAMEVAVLLRRGFTAVGQMT